MATTVNKPRLERREAVISATELLDKLKGFGSDRAPEYGVYLMRVAGQRIKMYDLANQGVILRAENIIHYTGKGFTPTVSDKSLDGRKKVDILEELGMTTRHDTVPKREPGTTEIREMFGKNDELIAGAKKGGRTSKAEREEEESNKLMTRAEWEAQAKSEPEGDEANSTDTTTSTTPVKTQTVRKGTTPPAPQAGLSSDPKKDQSVKEAENAKDPAAQENGALYPNFQKEDKPRG